MEDIEGSKGWQCVTDTDEVLNLKLTVQQLQDKLRILHGNTSEEMLELLSERETEINHLKSEVKGRDEKLVKVAQSFKELYAQRNHLQTELANEKAELEQQRSRVTELDGALAASKAEVESKQSRLEEWEAKFNSCDAQLQEVSEELDDVRRDSQVQANTLRNELIAAQSRIDILQRDMTDLQQRTSDERLSSEEQLNRLRELSIAQARELQRMNSTSDSLQQSLNQAILDNKQRDTQLDEATRLHTELRAQVAELNSILEARNTSLKQATGRIEHLQTILEEKEADARQLLMKFNDLKQEKAEQRTSWQKEVDGLRNEAMQLHEHLRQAKLDGESRARLLNAELDAHHKTVDDLQDMLTAERSQHATEMRKLNSNVDENGRYTKQLEDRVKAERARRKQLEQELTELRENADTRSALERKIVQLEARNEQLMDKIDRQEKYMKRKLGITATTTADETENEPPRSNEEGVYGFGDDRKPVRRSIGSEAHSATGRARTTQRPSTGELRGGLRR